MPDAVAIAREHLAILLSLTGMRVEEVEDAQEAERILGQFLDTDATLVVVQEEFLPEFSESFRDRLVAHHGSPLVVYCPSFDKEDSETDAYLASVLKPAVGYEIRLE